MPELLGTLHLSGKGGNELQVYDDSLVRVSTGLLARLGEVVPDQVVRRADVRSARLSRGRWPAKGLRRLTVQLHSGTVVRYDWAGDGATRPQNHDDFAVTLLRASLESLLEVAL
jgi:hypothetical protein